MNNFVDFFKGLVSLARPAEWTKSFGNMLFGFMSASFVFGVEFDLLKFVFGFFGVAFLWSGLYTLNDFTDWKADLRHPVKRLRAIPAGHVSPMQAFGFSIILLFAALYIGYLLNAYFLFCLLAMLLNQFLYTLKPFSFKKRPIVDLVSGSMINPLFRFFAGWTLFVHNFNAPILMLLFIVGLQFGGYSLYRMTSKEHEKELGYRSSVVVFGEKIIKLLAYSSIGIGIISFVIMTLIPMGIPEALTFGYLPLRYLWLVLGSLLLTPLYVGPLLDPKNADLKKLYRMVYLHYALFIIGFIVLFFFFD